MVPRAFPLWLVVALFFIVGYLWAWIEERRKGK